MLNIYFLAYHSRPYDFAIPDNGKFLLVDRLEYLDFINSIYFFKRSNCIRKSKWTERFYNSRW